MFGQKTQLGKSEFNAGILTTFGKLSQDDIDTIDGHSERLVTQLIQHYGWKPTIAQHKVEGFRAGLSGNSMDCKVASHAGVES